MRVIKHGINYELGKLTCPDCQCEFMYNKRDISTEDYYEDGQFGKDWSTKDIVSCPECKKHIQVEIKEG